MTVVSKKTYQIKIIQQSHRLYNCKRNCNSRFLKCPVVRALKRQTTESNKQLLQGHCTMFVVGFESQTGGINMQNKRFYLEFDSIATLFQRSPRWKVFSEFEVHHKSEKAKTSLTSTSSRILSTH